MSLLSLSKKAMALTKESEGEEPQSQDEETQVLGDYPSLELGLSYPDPEFEAAARQRAAKWGLRGALGGGALGTLGGALGMPASSSLAERLIGGGLVLGLPSAVVGGVSGVGMGRAAEEGKWNREGRPTRKTEWFELPRIPEEQAKQAEESLPMRAGASITQLPGVQPDPKAGQDAEMREGKAGFEGRLQPAVGGVSVKRGQGPRAYAPRLSKPSV